MRAAAVGSLQWAEATNGSLRGRDAVRFVASMALKSLSQASTRVLRRLGVSRERVARVDLDSIRIPDSRAAKEAMALCAESSPAFLVNHCVRTYIGASIFGVKDGLKYDEEVLYVASALHDLALTAHEPARDPRCRCFAVAGARLAMAFAEGCEWPAQRQARLGDAISLHMNPSVPVAQGVEAHLLHAGASLDVIGARRRELPVETLATLASRHPRLEMNRRLAELFENEGHAHPCARTYFLMRFGFAGLIRNNRLRA